MLDRGDASEVVGIKDGAGSTLTSGGAVIGGGDATGVVGIKDGGGAILTGGGAVIDGGDATGLVGIKDGGGALSNGADTAGVLGEKDGIVTGGGAECVGNSMGVLGEKDGACPPIRWGFRVNVTGSLGRRKCPPIIAGDGGIPYPEQSKCFSIKTIKAVNN